MKVTGNGFIIEDYYSCCPDQNYVSVTDIDGAKFLIKTTTLVKLYELVKFDLERRNGWLAVVEEISNG